MKKLLFVLILALIPAVAFSQTYFDVDFSGSFPPAGWTIDSHAANWSTVGTTNAGGVAPEVEFNWSPQFNGVSRLISPSLDLSGVSQLYVEFSHMLDHYGGAYTIGAATRSDGGAWNTVWQVVNPTANIDAEVVSVNIDNGDVGSSDFQFCWFFSGNSYNLDYWYIDDASLFQPLPHDAMVADVLIDDQYLPGESLTPQVVVQNFGLNSETITARCRIFLGGDMVYGEMIEGISLEPGEQATIPFPDYEITDGDRLFELQASTQLEGDQNTDNDEMTVHFNTYTTPRNYVVLEVGTGTWCQYCPGAAMGAEDLDANGYNMAIVEYHDGDNYETSESSARISYYGITGFPTAVFDGVEKFVGGSNSQSMYQYYVPIVEMRQPINCAFDVDIFGDNDGNNYSLSVVVSQLAEHNYDNLMLQVALTESGIQEYWQGQTHLEWVHRDQVQIAAGTPIDFAGGDQATIELSFTKDPSWVLEECELVAFVQTNTTKEILQANKVMLPDLIPTGIEDDVAALPLTTGLSGNYPNPFNPSTTINYSLAQPGHVTLEIYNMIGQKVTTLLDEQQDAGNHAVVWNGRTAGGGQAASGVYFYKMVAGDYTGTQKMVLTK